MSERKFSDCRFAASGAVQRYCPEQKTVIWTILFRHLFLYFIILGMHAVRRIFLAATVIEFPEKLHKLQPVCVHICAQQINTDIERMSNDEHHQKQNKSQNTAAKHAAHFIKDRSNNTCCKSQCQQSGIGQNIAEIACYAIEFI